MNGIFLDVDGVLNCAKSKARIGGVIGIEDSKVRLLKQIVLMTKARIVLVSTWKNDWDANADCCTQYGAYLNRKLNRERLFVCDKTRDSGADRGAGIHNYLKTHNVENWIVIDDEIFEDYDSEIMSRLVHTDFEDGLQQEHVWEAIEKMFGKEKQ